jgi:hypothetical protein
VPDAYRRLSLEPAASEFPQEHALLIFTEMSNTGFPLATTLATILLTGMKYAIEIERDGTGDAMQLIAQA